MARPRQDAEIALSEAQELTAGLIDRLTCPPGKQQAFMRDSKVDFTRFRRQISASSSKLLECLRAQLV
jgi:hypothetical protein